MAKLLVSVRSAAEARTALAGGAAIIDVKEPDHGSLGLAPWSVWQDVCQTVSTAAPISVALGELPDWLGSNCPAVPTQAWAGITYRKLGLAGTGPGWQSDWQSVRARLVETDGPAWIAVIYADWQTARAPDPDAILELAIRTDCVAGVLIDTWDKTRPGDLDDRWVARSRQVRQAGKLMALAGGLSQRAIPSLARFAPDIVAVRGAACVDGNRRLAVDPARVESLAHLVSRLR